MELQESLLLLGSCLGLLRGLELRLVLCKVLGGLALSRAVVSSIARHLAIFVHQVRQITRRLVFGTDTYGEK